MLRADDRKQDLRPTLRTFFFRNRKTDIRICRIKSTDIIRCGFYLGRFKDNPFLS